MGRIDVSKFVFPFFFLCTIVYSITPLLASFDLSTLTSYETFVSLLDAWYIERIYFARVVLANLDYMNFSLLKLCATMLTSFSVVNLIIIILVGYLWAASHESYMKQRNKMWISIVGIYLFGYILVLVWLLLGFEVISVGKVILLFKGVGIILLVVHILLILCSILYLYYEYKAYQNDYK